MDALSKNGSLTFLNLGPSGIQFSGEYANGLVLVEKMNHSVASLSSLELTEIQKKDAEVVLPNFPHQNQGQAEDK